MIGLLAKDSGGPEPAPSGASEVVVASADGAVVVVEGATEVVVWGATVLGDEVSAEAWGVVEAWVVEEAWVLVVVVGAPAQATLLPNTATATSAEPSMTDRLFPPPRRASPIIALDPR